tara:strand:+ start:3203 stop:4231 length:1029 start_codon:yes stop_codon:yes gene_type:complete
MPNILEKLIIFIIRIFFKLIFALIKFIRKILFKISLNILFISESLFEKKIYPYMYSIDYSLSNFLKNNSKQNYIFKIFKFLQEGENSTAKISPEKNNYSTWSEFNFRSILITVDQNSERTKSTLKKLHALSIQPDIFLGKTPKNLVNHIDTKNPLLSTSRPRDIACFVSHLLAIKYAIDNFDNEFFLIMEEDVILFHNPKLVGLSSVLTNKDWEVLQLEHVMPECVNRNKRFYQSGILLHRWMNPVDYGASAYIIRRKFAQNLIKYFLNSDNDKIDLKKCYQYNYPIVTDNIIYDIAQTLVFTFPLAQQDLDFPSLLGYPSYITKLRIASKNLVNEIWRDYT